MSYTYYHDTNFFFFIIGRQSLTRLSAFIAEFSCFQIVLSTAYGGTEWRDDMKNLMLSAGLKKQETVFLFSDTQVLKSISQFLKKKYTIPLFSIFTLHTYIDKNGVVPGRSEQHAEFWGHSQHLSTRRTG